MKVKSILTDQFTQRPAGIVPDTIVLHTMYHPYDDDFFCLEKCWQWLRECGVSAHYIIDRVGTICQSVLESDMAWHAGESKMPFSDDRRCSVNHFSLGIELLATQHSGLEQAQYQSLALLIIDITSRHNISAIVGHRQIAPARKTDPWQLDADRLAALLTAHGYTNTELLAL